MTRKPRVPGVLRRLDDIEINTHPMPIVFYPDHFVTLCIDCGGPIAARRATLQAAVCDRLVHQGAHP